MVNGGGKSRSPPSRDCKSLQKTAVHQKWLAASRSHEPKRDLGAAAERGNQAGAGALCPPEVNATSKTERAHMSAYAIARLTDVRMGPDIAAYLERIDATLEPFGGRFLVHGGPYDRLEGDWTGDVVIIAFPDRRRALDWYNSPGYRDIVGLRIANSVSEAIIIDGVAADHRATDILARSAQ